MKRTRIKDRNNICARARGESAVPRAWFSLLVVVFAMTCPAGAAMAQATLGSEIAPTGKLRGAVIGIRVLGGVGEPIGRFIATRLGTTFEPVR